MTTEKLKDKLKQYLYNIAFFPVVLLNSKPGDFKKKYPVYVFHHIPKCGGTSMNIALRKWFFVVKDYLKYSQPERLPYFAQHKVNIESLRAFNCLCGHFALPETHLKVRYPEVLNNENFKIFTFLRDPLELRISYYYFQIKRGRNPNATLEEFLLRGNNFIARSLDCTSDNYKEILGRYFFIGIVEHLQHSLDHLAKLLGKPKVKLPYLNRARRDSQASLLSPETIGCFKAKNELDYLIYDYCLKKFQENVTIGNNRSLSN